MRAYHYATISAQVVLQACQVPIPPDSYLAGDAETQALLELLRKGYRWIRTDGEYAIFEKTLEVTPREVLEAFKNGVTPKKERKQNEVISTAQGLAETRGPDTIGRGRSARDPAQDLAQLGAGEEHAALVRPGDGAGQNERKA